MKEILKKRMILVEKGEQIDKDIVLVADSIYYSCLKVVGKVIGNVSISREDLCPTDTNVIVTTEGSLDGDIYNVDKVDIAGQVSGNIKSKIVIIRQGAVIRGNINCVVLYGNEAVAQEGVYCFFQKAAMPED